MRPKTAILKYLHSVNQLELQIFLECFVFVYFCVVTTLNLMKSVSLLSFAALSIIVAGLVSSCSKDSDGTITPPVPDVPVAKNSK